MGFVDTVASILMDQLQGMIQELLDAQPEKVAGMDGCACVLVEEGLDMLQGPRPSVLEVATMLEEAAKRESRFSMLRDLLASRVSAAMDAAVQTSPDIEEGVRYGH